MEIAGVKMGEEMMAVGLCHGCMGVGRSIAFEPRLFLVGTTEEVLRT